MKKKQRDKKNLMRFAHSSAMRLKRFILDLIFGLVLKRRIIRSNNLLSGEGQVIHGGIFK